MLLSYIFIWRNSPFSAVGFTVPSSATDFITQILYPESLQHLLASPVGSSKTNESSEISSSVLPNLLETEREELSAKSNTSITEVNIISSTSLSNDGKRKKIENQSQRAQFEDGSGTINASLMAKLPSNVTLNLLDNAKGEGEFSEDYTLRAARHGHRAKSLNIVQQSLIFDPESFEQTTHHPEVHWSEPRRTTTTAIILTDTSTELSEENFSSTAFPIITRPTGYCNYTQGVNEGTETGVNNSMIAKEVVGLVFCLTNNTDMFAKIQVENNILSTSVDLRPTWRALKVRRGIQYILSVKRIHAWSMKIFFENYLINI